MNRALGEGRITNMVKKYAYIQDERIGRVYFPISAACVITPDLNDLRDKFQTDELVIYTGSKQPSVQNNCTYVANSVVRKKDLITVSGRISEVCEKFCYVEAKRYGRIFVPFSARSNSRPWLGKGAERNKEVTVKIFRQPDINQCKYVAYGITLDSDESLRNLSKNGESVEYLRDQIGVICYWPTSGDAHVYSAHSGLSKLSANLRRPWMCFGRFVRFEAIKHNHDKLHWSITKCFDMGEFYPIIPDRLDPSKIYLEVPAVINRISTNPSNRCSWLWNDLIGRIFVNSGNFRSGLRVMECVTLKCHFAGSFEDVPWFATDMQLLGPNEEIRAANSQLLTTDDDWTVTFISTTSSFYGFMDNPRLGQGFLAWTDIAESEPPQPGTKCRVSFYNQQRNKKQQLRAVLITPLNPNGVPVCHHPMYPNSGVIRLPEPLEPPVVESTQSSSVSSPAPTIIHNFPPLEPTSLPPPIGAKSNSNLKINGHSSLTASNGITAEEVNSLTGPLSALMETADLSMQPIHPVDTLGFTPLSLGSPKMSSSVSASDNLSDRNGSSNDVYLPMFASNGSWQGTEYFNVWKPVDDASSKDVGTQTEMFVEQALLRDLFKNTELLKKILVNFPEHTENIMSMSAVWKSY